MSETKWKPCPFCGGEISAYADKYKKVMIECKHCKMYFGIQLEIDCELRDGWKATLNSREEAIKRWNTRKPMDNIVAELEEKAEQYRQLGFENEREGRSNVADKHYYKQTAYLHAIIVRQQSQEGGTP